MKNETVLEGGGRVDTVITVSGDAYIDGVTVSGAARNGGVYVLREAAITMRNCLIHNNQGSGLSMEAALSRPFLIDNCRFEENEASLGGGIRSNSNAGDDVISNSVFKGNKGGGICCRVNTIRNNLFVENSPGSSYGCVVDLSIGTVSVQNNTVVGNNGNKGGGVCWGPATHVELVNNIIWGNEPNDIMIDATASPFPSVDAHHNNWENAHIDAAGVDLEPGLNGPGNISADPMFVDPDAGDFRLAEGSPCIDTGDLDAGVTDDITGEPRDAKPDMGAYEHR